MNKNDISKFLSFILRHQPEAIDLTLDTQGWAVIDELIACAVKQHYVLSHDIILAVVIGNDKKRFEISEDGSRIRAVQGHSTQQVDISYQPKKPPAILYHGTAIRFLESIRDKGVIPKSRQYVHLSADEATALQVGQRHGKPVVLKINAQLMYEQGVEFFQAENGVWLTKAVPYLFVEVR